MSQGSPDSNRHAISVALFGMLVLTLGMGIGRFLYTPMLPVLLSEGQFTFDQLSWIASANYAGYLAGSLLFSFGLFHLPSRLRPMLLTSALATAGLILAMASVKQPTLVMLIRFLAGVASAGMMIFGSMIVLHHTRHPFVIAALFSGVGAGILLGNEYVISGLHFALSSHTLWLGGIAMPDGEFTDPKRLRGHDARQRLLAAAGDKQRGFWRNVYGDHFAGHAARPST